MQYPLRWASLGIVGFVLVLQAVPCSEEAVGCGASVGSDAVQSCDEWVDIPSEADRSDVAVRTVEAASYLSELASFGVSMPDVSEAVAGGFAVSSTAQSIGRMEEYVLERAQQSAADDLVEVVLDLGDLPFPELPRLRIMDPISRHQVLLDRKALIEREQQNLVAYLEEVGARTSRPTGLVNHLHAWVPPDAMLGVGAHPDVETVYPAWQPVTLLYDHEELRQATFLSEYWDQEIKGETGGAVCDPRVGHDDIKIAVIEGRVASMVLSNRINSTHPGWGDCQMGSCESRIRSELSCSVTDPDSDACLSWVEGPYDIGAHGTWVASIAAGDLTQGQDPAITDPDERRKRTGIAPEASILYLNASSAGNVANAIAFAFLQGADVINLSLAIIECTYDQGAFCGGLNDVFRMVTEGGALVVAGAGNENAASGRCDPNANCNVCYPAIRPEVLSVANVDTPIGIDYDLAQISSDSSRGWARVGVGGQFAALYPTGVDISAVSISAPGTLCSYFSSRDTYDDAGRSGTSFAAPVVSAGAGLIRQELGYPVWDARMLKSHVLAMGDGSGGDVLGPGVTVGMSSTWGAGRVKFHPFESMQGPKGMAHRSFEIQEDELVVFNAANTEGAAFEVEVTQWKMGMHVAWSDLSAIPYLLITYWNACDRDELIAWDLSAGLERHIVLDGPAVDQACIEVRVFGYSVPASGVEFFVTDYYHSGDASAH
jgi:hypothetical protein